MKAQLRVLSGPRKGMHGVFSGQVRLGRHPDSEFPLDPDTDLDVSARHAIVARQGDRWIVKDLGSRNGTLVNGHPVRGVATLSDTDQIRLGPDGPHIEFRLVPDNTPDARPVPPKPAPTAPAAPGPQRETADHRVSVPRQSTTQRIRIEVGRQTRRLRTLTVVLFGLFLLAAGAFVWDNRRQEALRQQEVAAMQARIDSILAASEQTITSLQGRLEGLASALRRSQQDVQALQRELVTARNAGDAARVETLSRRLADATAALRNQQIAAEVDYEAITEANQYAIAMVWVDFGPAGVQTATAFAVTPDGKLVTNRHVVAGERGTNRPRRIAIQFTNSSQVWRGQVLATHPDPAADLAVIQVLGIAGEVPTVRGFRADNRPLAVGTPVATIGFPLGEDLPMRARGEHPIVRASLSAGLVSKLLPDQVQVDGYGAEGASGSPIFDRNGDVVAVLYGGQPGTDGRIVFGVPVRYVREMLAGL